MLRTYRRHLGTCKHKDKGRDWMRCACPIWVDGTIDGRRVLKSLDTSNQQIAADKVLSLEANKTTEQSSVTDAVDSFLRDRAELSSVDKYKVVLTTLKNFCSAQNITSIRGVKLTDLDKFKASLPDSPLTVGKKVERLRTFFSYCLDRQWCDTNPAAKLRKPTVMPTMKTPFTTEQWAALLEAVEHYPTQNSFGYDNRARLRAFVLMLRYTALRISDLTRLEKSRVKDGRLLLRTNKTGKPIHLPLPPDVLDALKKVENGERYFWSGKGLLKSAVGDWQRSLRRLFELAKFHGSAHVFRHTLATDLLSHGVSVEHVADILGNSPDIVRKHYAPWVDSRQKALDEAVMRTWV